MIDEFEHSALVAIALLVRLHDRPSMAADLLIEMGLSEADCSSLDDFDKEFLVKMQGERRGAIRLKGLEGTSNECVG